MTPAERLNTYIAEGRLIRKAWTGTDAQGRETACLLAAMSPDVAAKHEARACPADIMPQWFAELTPWIDDAGSVEAWPGMVRRYAALAARWHVLTPEDWRRLDYRVRLICLDEADRHYAREYFIGVAVAVGRVREMLIRASEGFLVKDDEWESARAEATKMAAAANARAAWAATAAAAAMWVARAATATATEAAEAAAEAAEAAEAAAPIGAKAVDRITAAIFDAMEAAIALRETTP